jgi:sulfofructose kinase
MSLAERRRADRPPRILCAGIAVYDHVYRLDHFPPPGAKLRAREFAAVGGGCAANAALAIVRLGGEAALASPLGAADGSDPTGDLILVGLAREGVDGAACVRVPGATSPISAILVDPSGERLIVNHRDERLSDARAADPDRLVSGYDTVLADNRFADFVLPLCAAARAQGKPAILDGDRPTQATDALLTTCSHVVFAADGLRATARCDDLGEALRAIAQRSGAFLAVTDGERDILWLDREVLRRLPVRAVGAVDTLAAGDVFHGAFALAIAEGMDEEAALGFASAAATIKCTRFGGSSGAPTRVEVDQFMELNVADAGDAGRAN